MKFLIIFALSFYVSSSSADDHTTRQHGTHVHGVGKLNVVLENNNLVMELISPAKNIVGFEHQPSNDEHKAVISQANQTLRLSDRLFSLSEQARCQFKAVQIETDLQDKKQAKAHHDETHLDHEDKQAADSDHDGHNEPHSDHEEESHTEFHVEYLYECSDLDKLSQIEVLLFEEFPLMKTLNVEVLTSTQQLSLELDKDNKTIRFNSP